MSRAAIITVVLVLVAAGCGDDGATEQVATTTTATAATGDPAAACALFAEANAKVTGEGLSREAGDLYKKAAAEATAADDRRLSQAGEALTLGIIRLEQEAIAAAVLLFDEVCADLGY